MTGFDQFLKYFSRMSFDDPRTLLGDQFQAFAEKYDLRPGFQADYDLRALFGDLVDDQSFVRDRVSFIRSYNVSHVITS